jgi:hypothetical protein
VQGIYFRNVDEVPIVTVRQSNGSSISIAVIILTKAARVSNCNCIKSWLNTIDCKCEFARTQRLRVSPSIKTTRAYFCLKSEVNDFLGRLTAHLFTTSNYNAGVLGGDVNAESEQMPDPRN